MLTFREKNKEKKAQMLVIFYHKAKKLINNLLL